MKPLLVNKPIRSIYQYFKAISQFIMHIVNLHPLGSLRSSPALGLVFGFGVRLFYRQWIYSFLFGGEDPFSLMRTNEPRNFANFPLL